MFISREVQERYGRKIGGEPEYFGFRGNQAQPRLPHKQFLLIFGGKLGRDRRIVKTTVRWKPNIAGPYKSLSHIEFLVWFLSKCYVIPNDTYVYSSHLQFGI